MLEAAPGSQGAEASETCITEGEVEEAHLNASIIFFCSPFEETREKHRQWITNGDFKKMTSKKELGLGYGYLGW